MSQQKLNKLIVAFRKDLKAIDSDTYVPRRPHPVMGGIDAIDDNIDARQLRKAA